MWKYYLTLCISLVIVITLTGCVASTLTRDYVLDASTGKGLLVFSYTTNQDADNPFLDYRNLMTGDKGEIIRNTKKDPLDWESPTKGRLVVLEFDSGLYEFYSWSIVRQGMAARGFSVPFEIFPGKATYAGNIHLTIQAEGLFDLQVTDAYERDIALFHRRFPAINDKDVLKHVAILHF